MKVRLALSAILGLAAIPAMAAGEADKASAKRTVNQALRADGPFYTPEEQAVINRKCGYAPGEWAGFEMADMGDAYQCTNGKRLNDPEIQALMRVAQPRIQRRVSAVMARPEIKAALAQVAEDSASRSIRKKRESRGEDLGWLAAGPKDSALRRALDRAMNAGGPLFKPQERALIERKCGYSPGSWSGEDFSMTEDDFVCTNGRRVNDPEVRAMMKVAGPRIGRRVSAAMAQPEVQAAINEVANEAAAQATRQLHGRR
jgi:hypothetical protein